MTATKKLSLRRSTRYGVGKEIGGAVYVHFQYQGLLGPAVEAAAARLPPGFDYTVVKVQRRTGVVSFIHSPDFDTAPEPVVGELWTIAPDGTARRMQKAPRHSEVDQENPTALEPNNQILAAPLDSGDTLPFELGRHLGRVVRTDEARVVDPHVIEAPTGERRLELLADALDLRQLRHEDQRSRGALARRARP